MSIGIVSYTYPNVKTHLAMFTDHAHINEVIAYMLGERIMLGLAWEGELDVGVPQYLAQCLDPLDLPLLDKIYEKIKAAVERISADYVFQALETSGELYLKYDYHVGKNFSRLQFYVDPSESAWRLW